MLKLKFKNEPYWLDLGMGVRVKVKPCTSSVFYEAKAFMNSKVAEYANRIKDARENGIKDNTLPDLEDKNSRCSGCFCRKRRSFLGFSKRRKALQKSLENE